MSERTKKFADELAALIEDGERLLLAMQYDCHRDEVRAAYLSEFEGAEEKLEKFLSELPNFKGGYQKWYSTAQAVIKQVLPDRLPDFTSHYEYPRVRKSISFHNYMIRDYLQGLQVTRGDYEVVVDKSAAIPEFHQQLEMVKAAKDTLELTLMDLRAVLQADLFDTEIDTAGGLAKAGYLRAAGAICGVVIEKHLHQACENHGLKSAKKNPTISELAQLLRTSGSITLAQERFIQSLADTRNLCSHAKGREPTKEEIAELVEGTGKVLKTIF